MNKELIKEIAEYMLNNYTPYYHCRFDDRIYFKPKLEKLPNIDKVIITRYLFRYGVLVVTYDEKFNETEHYASVKLNRSLYKSAYKKSEERVKKQKSEQKEKAEQELKQAFNNLKEENAK